MAQAAKLHLSGIGLSWGLIYFLLFAYRSLASVLGELVVRRITSIGDTSTFQSGFLKPEYSGSEDAFRDNIITAIGSDILGSSLSTIATVRLGGLFNNLMFGNIYLINICFQSITFIGLVYLLQSVARPVRFKLLVLVMLPSFTLWTSIASKEAIVAGMVAVLSGYFIRMYSGHIIPNIVHVFAAFTLFVFKPHYGVAFAYGIVSTLICSVAKKRALTALLLGITSVWVLFIFRDAFTRYAFLVQNAFFREAFLAQSTRSELFFLEESDVFFKAPEGLMRAFFGPTFSEISVSVLHFGTFLEGAVLVAALLYFVARVMPRLPIYNAIVATFMAFWILFPNYPFGVINPGSAIRYRSGWILLIVVLFSVFLSRDLYANWRTSLSAPIRSRTRRVQQSSPPISGGGAIE